MTKFSENQISFIDDLLIKTSKGDVNYSDLNYTEYSKTFSLINKDPYHLFDSNGDKIWLSQLGNEIINDFNGSFKKYLEYEKSKSDLNKQVKTSTIKTNFWTPIHTRISLVITFIFLIIALLTYIIKYTENKSSNQKDSINPSMETNDSTKINHLTNKDTIGSDSVSTVIIPDSSKH